jgi:hypothetical protein
MPKQHTADARLKTTKLPSLRGHFAATEEMDAMESE